MVIVLCPKCKSGNITPMHFHEDGQGFSCMDCYKDFNANEMIFCHDWELQDNE